MPKDRFKRKRIIYFRNDFYFAGTGLQCCDTEKK